MSAAEIYELSGLNTLFREVNPERQRREMKFRVNHEHTAHHPRLSYGFNHTFLKTPSSYWYLELWGEASQPHDIRKWSKSF